MPALVRRPSITEKERGAFSNLSWSPSLSCTMGELPSRARPRKMANLVSLFTCAHFARCLLRKKDGEEKGKLALYDEGGVLCTIFASRRSPPCRSPVVMRRVAPALVVVMILLRAGRKPSREDPVWRLVSTLRFSLACACSFYTSFLFATCG